MIILGIDPGLANTGWGVIETTGSKCRCLAYGCITTHAHQPVAKRLCEIYEDIRAVIRRHGPVECAIESIFFGINARSAFATGQARGVALLATAEASLAITEYSPPQIKGAVVGVGTAEKEQISYMVRILLGLDHEPTPDHAADALAAAICHAHLGRHQALAAKAAGA
ncbi:MAG: crossover junction endodeoxyribonuclease RuvC [Coriobacteriia bacterium]|nr:crossover junction endodeoxyribonuclease RuvC [Coriobacteriia bacterium]